MKDEVANLLIDCFYRNLLGRAPDFEGYSYWKSQLENTEDLEHIYDNFLNSPEYNTSSYKPPMESIKEFLDELLIFIDEEINIIDIGCIPLEYEPYIWEIMSEHSNLNVIGFDPQINSSSIELTSRNKSKKISFRTHPMALGDGEKHYLYINNDSSTTSMYRIREGLPFNHLSTLKVEKTDYLETNRLDDVDTPDKIHLLKLDVQGYELDILRHSTQTLRKVEILVAEVEYVEIYKGQPLFNDINQFMIDNDFELVDVVGTKYSYEKAHLFKSKDFLVWGDAVYRKRTRLPSSLYAQAFVLGTVFGKWNAAEYLWDEARKFSTAIISNEITK